MTHPLQHKKGTSRTSVLLARTAMRKGVNQNRGLMQNQSTQGAWSIQTSSRSN